MAAASVEAQTFADGRSMAPSRQPYGVYVAAKPKYVKDSGTSYRLFDLESIWGKATGAAAANRSRVGATYKAYVGHGY